MSLHSPHPPEQPAPPPSDRDPRAAVAPGRLLDAIADGAVLRGTPTALARRLGISTGHLVEAIAELAATGRLAVEVGVDGALTARRLDATAPPAPGSGRRGSRARIAAINDDPAILELLRELLGVSEGYDVVTCTVGEQAHDFVKERRPDLILLDIRMGGEEIGWTVLERLTLDPETRPIPVIVSSAAVTRLAEHGSRLERYGVEVLPKPFDLDVLLEKVAAGLASGHG